MCKDKKIIRFLILSGLLGLLLYPPIVFSDEAEMGASKIGRFSEINILTSDVGSRNTISITGLKGIGTKKIKSLSIFFFLPSGSTFKKGDAFKINEFSSEFNCSATYMYSFYKGRAVTRIKTWQADSGYVKITKIEKGKIFGRFRLTFTPSDPANKEFVTKGYFKIEL